MIRRQLIGAFATSAALAAGPAFAQSSAEDTTVSEIVVTGRYTAAGLSTPQHVLPLVDTPQSVTVIEDDLMAEQGRSTLRDAMRNVTGSAFRRGRAIRPAVRTRSTFAALGAR